MNITNQINKLHNDYHNANYVVNKSIKYAFNYNNSHTYIYYSQENELQNQIILVICVNNIYYLTAINISEHNGEYSVKRYIPNEIYSYIKDDVFANDNYKTSPYFDKLFDTIITTNPCITNYKIDIKKHNLYDYKNEKECPFFQTFVRQNMSSEMKNKIMQRYDTILANQIIDYCHKNNKTLRFTSNFEQAHDIIFAMENI